MLEQSTTFILTTLWWAANCCKRVHRPFPWQLGECQAGHRSALHTPPWLDLSGRPWVPGDSDRGYPGWGQLGKLAHRAAWYSNLSDWLERLSRRAGHMGLRKTNILGYRFSSRLTGTSLSSIYWLSEFKGQVKVSEHKLHQTIRQQM